eukprot:SAG22_NODE_388_length_11295_cov_14.512594_18_plen_119_part_00
MRWLTNVRRWCASLIYHVCRLGLVSGSTDSTVRLWNPQGGGGGAAVAVLRGGHGGSGIRALAALPAAQLASGGTDGSVTLWQAGPAAGWYGVGAEATGSAGAGGGGRLRNVGTDPGRG